MRWGALLLLMGACSAAASPQSMIREHLDSTVQERLLAMDIPGAAIAVVQLGRPRLLVGFGTVNPATGEPVNPSRHVFRVGSISKLLTAATVLRVLEAQGMDIRGDLRRYLSELPVRPSLEQPLSMHHLLTHTAGFNERLFGQHVIDHADFRDLSSYLKQHLPPRFIEPGRLIAYNDHDTVLAAWIAERVSGRSFPELAERLLLESLGMTTTTFRQLDQPATVAGNRVVAWHREGDVLRPYAPDLVISTPAAGAWSTARDMAAYAEALLDCQALGAYVCQGQLRRQAANHMLLPGRTYGFAEARHGSLRVLIKDGQASGFNARLLIVPERGFGIFVVHNRNILGRFGAMLPASRFCRETTSAVLELLYPMEHREATVPQPVMGAGRRTQRYAGDYRNVVAARHTWERIIGMFDDVHVTATTQGVDFGSGEFVEVEPGVVQWHRGGDSYRVFATDGDVATHVFIGAGAYERIPWYLASWFTPWFVLGVMAWLSISAVGGAVGFEGRRRLVAVTPPAAFLLFLIGFPMVMALTDVQVFFRGPTTPVLGLLALPLLGGAAMLGQLTLLRAGQPASAGWRRLLVAVNIVVGAVLLLWLDYWNLLGYRLG